MNIRPRVRTLLRRLAQGALSTGALVLVPALGRVEAMSAPKLWILLAVGTLAHVLQPAFSPLARGAASDRGTATQILWSVAVTQLLAIVEALYLRYPESMRFSAFAVGALVVMVAGLALRTWAVHTLGRYFTWHIHVEPGQEVITRGPYRLVRHPGYLGPLMTYLAVPLFLSAWVSFAVAAIALPLAFARRIRHEERALIAELGQSYLDYRDRVGGLVPRLRKRERARAE